MLTFKAKDYVEMMERGELVVTVHKLLPARNLGEYFPTKCGIKDSTGPSGVDTAAHWINVTCPKCLAKAPKKWKHKRD